MATDPVQAETSNVLEAVPVRELVGHSNRITSGHYVTGIVEYWFMKFRCTINCLFEFTFFFTRFVFFLLNRGNEPLFDFINKSTTHGPP